MKNKNLLIGGAVVVGGLLFFYFRNKRNAETSVDMGVGAGVGTGAGTGTGTGISKEDGKGEVMPITSQPSTSTATPTSKLSNFEVNSRVLKSCGLMPPSFKKNKRNQWDDCKDRTKAELRSQGLISFNGLSEDNVSRLDFDGNIVD